MTALDRRTLGLVGASLLLGALVSPVRAHSGDQQRFAIIVHPSNTARFAKDEEARQFVRKLFLRTASSWHGDLEAKPYFPDEKDPAYRALVDRVLGMSAAELARHWITMKNTRGIAPPKVVAGAARMRKYVSHFEGGVGIVPFEEGLGSGKDKVRVLFTVEVGEK